MPVARSMPLGRRLHRACFAFLLAVAGAIVAPLAQALGVPAESLPCVQDGGPELAEGQLAWVVIDTDPVVQGAEILLGEISCIGGDPELAKRLAVVNVGAAPLVGGERQLAKATLNLRMRQAGIDDRQVHIVGPDTLFIRRAASVLETDELLGAVQAEVLKGLPAGAQLELEFQSGVGIAVPPGEYEVQVTRVPSRLVGPISIGADIYVEGKLWKSLTLRANASLTVPAWVSTEPIYPGEPIGEHNTEVRPITVKGALDPAWIDAGVPLRANRIIQPGSVIEARFVEPIPDVVAGQQVVLSIERPGMQITAYGTLLADAMIGDIVQVRNASSGRTLSGKLVSPERVVIGMP